MIRTIHNQHSVDAAQEFHLAQPRTRSPNLRPIGYGSDVRERSINIPTDDYGQDQSLWKDWLRKEESLAVSLETGPGALIIVLTSAVNVLWKVIIYPASRIDICQRSIEARESPTSLSPKTFFCLLSRMCTRGWFSLVGEEVLHERASSPVTSREYDLSTQILLFYHFS